MAKVDLTLLTQKEEWKVGEAFNYIDKEQQSYAIIAKAMRKALVRIAEK